MQSPPPFSGGTPKKKTNTGLIIGLIIGAVLLCCVLPIGGLIGGAFYVGNKAKGFIGCTISVDLMAKSMNDYLAAHDNTYPKAEHWQDDLRPYYKTRLDKQSKEVPFGLVPAEGAWPCSEEGGGQSGFAFNSDVAGKKRTEVNPSTVVIFEVPEVKMNNSMTFKKQDPAVSPKILGERRPWYEILASGELIGAKGSSRININTGSGGGLSKGSDSKE